MFETPFAMVGNIVNDPILRRVGDQDVTRFRMASNSRRRTADGSWEPGNSLFVTVNCWGRLASGVGGVLTKGDPVVVLGHVYTSEYEDKAGIRRSSMEVRATSVGPDLARIRVRVDPTKRVPAVDPEPDADAGGEQPTTEDSGDDGGNDEALPLSA
jgi:single-strand DNA-binding protein